MIGLAALTLPFHTQLTDYQRDLIKLWLPALIAGSAAWLVLLIGQTPLARAAGLALVVTGAALALRWMGWLLAMTGALALAFCPAFWSQAGGGDGTPATIVLALSAAAGIGVVAIGLSRRPYIALLVALAVFGVIFTAQIGEARSLRLTALTSAWLIYLLTRAVLITNPRPDGPPPALLTAQYRAGVLLLLAVGIINDPLPVLFIPAVVLTLSQTKMRIPYWYWALLAGLTLLGVYGMTTEYYSATWWGVNAAQAAEQAPLPYLVAAGWRDPVRWLDLVNLIAGQFSILGAGLSVLGLARLARWYPVLGVLTMVAYAAFFAFGLAYYGADREALLLPMLVIQVLWMTYAVYTFGEWLSKSQLQAGRRLVQVAYVALPALLLWQIVIR